LRRRGPALEDPKTTATVRFVLILIVAFAILVYTFA
jgi:hypothetical protein